MTRGRGHFRGRTWLNPRAYLFFQSILRIQLTIAQMARLENKNDLYKYCFLQKFFNISVYQEQSHFSQFRK